MIRHNTDLNEVPPQIQIQKDWTKLSIFCFAIVCLDSSQASLSYSVNECPEFNLGHVLKFIAPKQVQLVQINLSKVVPV